MDYAAEKRYVESILATAREIRDRDIRVRMLIDSSVNAASGEMGRHIDPERADREAHELALMACSILAARIFTEDAELVALRAERDQYRKIAEKALLVRPLAPVVVTPLPQPGP